MDILELMRTRYTTKHYDPNRRVSERFWKYCDCHLLRRIFNRGSSTSLTHPR